MSDNNSKRFTVMDYGFPQGSYDTHEEALVAERRVNSHYWATATYIVDNETGEIVRNGEAVKI